MNRDKARFFDAYADAPWAAADYTDEELGKIEWLFGQCGVIPGQRVLEPGCGTGRITALLARRAGSQGSIRASDISGEMVKRARERCAGLTAVSIEQRAFEEMELKPQSFDLALFFNFFPHLDNNHQALEICGRVLAPGGTIAIFHLEPSAVINDLHRKAGTAVEHDMIPSQEKLESMLVNAGFEPLRFRDDDRYLMMARKK